MNRLGRQVALRRRLSVAWLLVGLLSIGSSALWAEGGQPITSPNDGRDYRYLTLDNQMQVLLVSDPAADKAAASLEVQVGSRDDPNDREGLAHFLEHMLFLGTKKYPEAGEYQSFIAARGGSHNAYTSFDTTNYYFNVAPDSLEPTLDRFAQFFVAPLFSEAYVEREKNAVNSEYSAKLKSDFRRSNDVLKTQLNPQHPLAKFTVGSLQTLADRPGQLVRDDLIRFYQKHYSANVMTLVVLGQENLDQLEAMVRPRFNPVPNQNVVLSDTDQPLFVSTQLPMELQIQPVKEIRQLSLLFPIPSTRTDYDKQPQTYISHLMGHEGEGSLLAVLKRQGWAQGLRAGSKYSNRSGALFEINISLTEAGELQRERIVALVFAHLQLIRERGVERWVFEEQGKIAQASFLYQEKHAPMHYVSGLAAQMAVYPVEDMLRGPYVWRHYDADLINALLARLTPDNLLLQWMAPSVQGNASSPHYQVPYQVGPISMERRQGWIADPLAQRLRLPQVNQFVSDQLQLAGREAGQTKPELLLNEAGLSVWYQQDQVFDVPKGQAFWRVRSPLAAASARQAVLTNMYVALVRDRLNPWVYPAQLAGLSYSVDKFSRGITFEVGGWTPKQPLLMAKIAEQLTNTQVDPSRFARLKEGVARRWRNAEKRPPYSVLMGDLPELLFRPYWSEAEMLEQLQTVTEAELQAFIPVFWQAAEVQALYYGNYQQQQVKAAAQQLAASLLTSGAGELVSAKVSHLPEQSLRWMRQLPHPDSALVWYLQSPSTGIADRAQAMLMAQMIKTPFYEELRTQRQRGYIVFAGRMPMMHVDGLVWVVQSPTIGVAQLQEEVGQFARDYTAVMAAMTADEFEQHRAAVLTRLTEEPQNLAEQARWHWDALTLGDTNFQDRERLIEAVKQMQRPDLVQSYRQLVSQGGAGLWLLASPEGAPKKPSASLQGASLSDPQRFKKRQPFYFKP